ncbi:MAG: S8 family serine peptidase [Nitrospirae bacterium]|nr:S8 family serine peptidase [Nitrospirota bacterium]
MDNAMRKRNWVVVSFIFVFAIFFAPGTFAEQPADKPPLPRPLLRKMYGPHTLTQRLQMQKAQAPKTQPPKPTKPACPPNCEELLEKARKYGLVRVIVGLNIPDLPDPIRLPKEERPKAFQARKEAIAKAQERLLKRMAKHKIAYIKKSEYFPDMAMTIDAAALEVLIADPEVRNIGEDVLMRPMLPQSVPIIGADQAHAKGFTGADYTVAILDTGVDNSHPFLAGKVVAEACFSTNAFGTNPVDGTPYTATTLCPNGSISQIGSGAAILCNLPGCDHGTHVAGIAAGNGSTFSGVAKDANIIAIQVFTRFDGTICDPEPSPCIRSYTYDQRLALDYILTQSSNYQIAAANMSLGGGQYTSTCDYDPTYVDMKTRIDDLRNAGIATVIASGNEGYVNALSAPACISTAISVGATTKADTVAGYSNSASFLNLLAPGGDGSGTIADILSSVPGGGFDYKAGTSMAAPHVAGAFAILKSQSPTANVSDILSILESSGVEILDSRNNISKPRIYLEKNIPWVARYNGPSGFHDIPTKIAIDISGNVYVTGYSSNTNSGVSTDITTVKYDPNGKQLWVVRYNNGYAYGEPTGLVVDAWGNVYITGYFCMLDSDNFCVRSDYITVKYDTNGNRLWAATYNEGGISVAAGIALDSLGNVYVTGGSCLGTYADCYESPNNSYTTIKYNTDGIQQWVARYDTPGVDDGATAVAVDPSGNVYVTGWSCVSTQSGCGGDYLYTTVKYDSNGNQLWTANYGKDVAYPPSAIAVDGLGNVYIAGGSDGYVTIKYTPSGKRRWVRTYGCGGATALTVDSSGNVYVTGYNTNTSCGASNLYTDYTTVKYNTNGKGMWVATYVDAIEHDFATDIALDSSGNVYVTGQICTEKSSEAVTCVNYVLGTIKYDNNGNQLWMRRHQVNNLEYIFYPSLAVDFPGNVYVTSTSCSFKNCLIDDGFFTDYVTLKYTPDNKTE